MSTKNSLSDTKPAKHEGVSRREFARRAAVATAAAAFPGAFLTEVVAASSETAHPEQAHNLTSLSPSSQTEVEIKVQAIFNKYGSRLNDEQKADIRRLATVSEGKIDKLRAYALDNSDQPATVLKPLMERPVRTAGPPTAAPAQKKKR